MTLIGQGNARQLLGALVCWARGKHLRGKFVREASFHDRYYACPRCSRETRYKVKVKQDAR